ncbi:TPA: hypothetical protein ACYJE7_004128, partial [Salmonella enterica]
FCRHDITGVFCIGIPVTEYGMNIIRGCMTGLTGIKLFLSGHLHTGNSPENFFAEGQHAG